MRLKVEEGLEDVVDLLLVVFVNTGFGIGFVFGSGLRGFSRIPGFRRDSEVLPGFLHSHGARLEGGEVSSRDGGLDGIWNDEIENCYSAVFAVWQATFVRGEFFWLNNWQNELLAIRAPAIFSRSECYLGPSNYRPLSTDYFHS